MRDLNLLPDLELALIQSELDWHDAAANRSRFEPLLEQARGADLVILPEMFSTGFSMHSAELAEPEEGPTTAWLRAARAAGVRTLGGLPMLIYQGALAFELWTGVHAPVETMFAAARKALAARGAP